MLRERERKLGGSALDCCAVSGRFVWALSPAWTIKGSHVSLEAGTYPPEHAAPAQGQTAVCERYSLGAKDQDSTAQRLRPRVSFTPCSGMAATCVLLAATRSHGQNYETGSLIYVFFTFFSLPHLFSFTRCCFFSTLHKTLVRAFAVSPTPREWFDSGKDLVFTVGQNSMFFRYFAFVLP